MPTRRTQRFPTLTGELMKLGQIWIIESLRDDDRHTGRALYEHLRDLVTAHSLDLRTTLRSVSSIPSLFACLDEIAADIAVSGRYPILDIECHGLDDFSGLQLSDGSNVSWEDLKPRLQAINVASRFNLFLILACCNGGYFGQIARLGEMSSVCAYLGPNANLPSGVLLEALTVFFSSLLTEKDVTAAFNTAIARVPNFPYFFSTAMGIFRMGAIEYIRDCATGKPLRDRARKIALASRPIPSINAVVRQLKKAEGPYFERCRRQFFAVDEFPENEQRFPVTYAELVHAAARSR